MTWLVRLCDPSQIDQRRQVIASSAQCLISRSPQQAGLAARNSVDLCAAARETKSISIAPLAFGRIAYGPLRRARGTRQPLSITAGYLKVGTRLQRRSRRSNVDPPGVSASPIRERVAGVASRPARSVASCGYRTSLVNRCVWNYSVRARTHGSRRVTEPLGQQPLEHRQAAELLRTGWLQSPRFQAYSRPRAGTAPAGAYCQPERA
jgi:hypothetical protein